MRYPLPATDADRTAPRRVLMTADTVGGVWHYALELVGALASHGVEVLLATAGGRLDAAQRAAAHRLKNLDVRESDARLEWMDDPWADVERTGEWLLELETAFRPDVVHLNDYAHGALPFRAPVLVVGHSCVYSWFEAVRGAAPPPAFDRYHTAVRAGLRGADLVTAPTRAMLDALRRHYGPFRAGPVVPNGRVLPPPGPAPREPFILTAGRLWDEAKNTAMLAAVAPRLPWPVYVAGETRHPDGLGEAAFGGVRALGRLSPDDLAAWMRRAAIYALSARYEPFGLSALEAACSGCALVLSDIPSLREVWGDAACYVDPGDPEALAATLRALIDDEPAREACARRCRARALTYSHERMAAGYVGLYQSLLAPAPIEARPLPA